MMTYLRTNAFSLTGGLLSALFIVAALAVTL
jgi:hypothetical protein